MGNNFTRLLKEAFKLQRKKELKVFCTPTTLEKAHKKFLKMDKKTCKWCTYYMHIGHICQKTGNCTEMEEKEYGTVCKFIDIDEDLKKEYPIKEETNGK